MRKLIIVVCLLLAVSVIAGCGVRTESTKYYFSPSWTRAGAIIYIGATKTVDKDIFDSQLSSTYSEYVRTVYPSGTGESSVLFDATDARPYAMTCSPTDDYVAYGDDLRSGLFRKIVIRNIATGIHTGIEMVELAFSPGIKSFDWSYDGTKLVYCTPQEVRMIDISGLSDSLIVADSNLEFVTWRYGSRIAFVRTSGSDKLLSLINSDGSNRLDLSPAASVDLPQISAANTDIIYGISGNSLAYVDVSAVTPSLTQVKANFTGELPRLSPDAKKVTYSKASESSGIYVMEVSTGSETKVR